MKAIRLLVLLLILSPCLLQAEVLFLKDGSSLVGKVLRVEGDTLYFQPSFGGAVLKFSRSNIERVQFDESEKGRSLDQYGMPAASTADPGSLIVRFDGMSLSNKIIVHRKRNYKEHERANAIRSSLVVDGLEVASVIDSTMEKVYREGPDTYLKNTFTVPDFHVALAAGPHSCLILIKNVGIASFKNAFEFAPLDLSLNVDNVVVYSGRITTIEIGKKRGALKLGMPTLYLKTYR